MIDVLYFTAPWCSPCKKLKPIVSQFSSTDDELKWTIVDIDVNPQIGLDHRIQSLPTFVALANGTELYRSSAVRNEATLNAFIEDVRWASK